MNRICIKKNLQIPKLLKLVYLLLSLLPVFSNPAYADSNYIIQVGDSIQMIMPGETALNKEFTVNRQGKILLPEVGLIKAAGETELSLQKASILKLSIAFRDLSNLRIHIIARRRIINVLGYVKNPGEIILPDRSGIQMAISAAGGLRKGAQLDQMQLRRGQQTTNFNYKHYLDSGNESLLPQLQSLDTIFVPASPVIGNIEQDFNSDLLTESMNPDMTKNGLKILGEINKPGNYPYSENTSIVDILMKAGGVTSSANVNTIRVINSGKPVLFNLNDYLDTGDNQALPILKPGTTIFIPSAESINSNEGGVYVMGEVKSPNIYNSQTDDQLIDLLAKSGGTTENADTNEIIILRADGKTDTFNLSQYIKGNRNQKMPYIGEGDSIYVPKNESTDSTQWLNLSSDETVKVIGEVGSPGRYGWSNTLTLIDLLAHAGGPTSDADTKNIEILTSHRNGTSRFIHFNLDDHILKGRNNIALPQIIGGTTIRLLKKLPNATDNKAIWQQQSSTESVYLFGQINAPGRYRLDVETNLLDLLSAASGPTTSADIQNIRISHRNGDHAMVSKVDLALYFETGDEQLIPNIKPGDTIYIPEKDRVWTAKSKEETIRVLGAVNSPGRYVFNDDMTLLDLLAEAGGPSSSADVKMISVVNLSCCKDQARHFNLTEFSQTGNFDLLPLVRNGDTVFIPEIDHSNSSQARQGLADIFQILSIASLLGLL